MRSTWSWACRPRDRCPRSATYTPGYPAAEVGLSLLGDLLRRPPVVPDGNNHRAHPSAGNQIRCPVMPCALSVFTFFFLSFCIAQTVLSFFLRLFLRFSRSFLFFACLERSAIGRSMIRVSASDGKTVCGGMYRTLAGLSISPKYQLINVVGRTLLLFLEPRKSNSIISRRRYETVESGY